MSKQTPVLFDRALDIAVEKTRGVRTGVGDEIVLVRDMRGRIRVLLPGRRKNYSDDKKTVLDKFSQELTETLGAYGFPPDRAVLFADDLVQGEQIIASKDRRLIAEEGQLKIYLLDRQITGQDWMRSPFKRETTTNRVTFFGIKGGVGRSTALVIWAWRLAKQGKNVLVFDLDLESPGVTSTLLPYDYLPDYGIVDWFVEDGVGQADIVEKAVVAASPLAKDLSGEIRIVPTYGRDTGDYLPKLSRCYRGFNGSDVVAWGERVQRMVETIEKSEKPDVVFLDSRAGLHDIAAVLVTRMGADAFLFAVDSSQTWVAYSFLFRHWREHPQVRDFRRRLQMVAGMVPETGREEHLKRFRENSWDLFRDHLYDEAKPDDPDAFSFDVADQDAPHYPVPVFWHRALQEFDPRKSDAGLDEKTVLEALGVFMDEAEKMVFSDGGPK
jgi:hypothetical protein